MLQILSPMFEYRIYLLTEDQEASKKKFPHFFDPSLPKPLVIEVGPLNKCFIMQLESEKIFCDLCDRFELGFIQNHSDLKSRSTLGSYFSSHQCGSITSSRRPLLRGRITSWRLTSVSDLAEDYESLLSPNCIAVYCILVAAHFVNF